MQCYIAIELPPARNAYARRANFWAGYAWTAFFVLNVILDASFCESARLWRSTLVGGNLYLSTGFLRAKIKREVFLALVEFS